MRSRPPRRGCGAHPRAGGENLTQLHADSRNGGSSPRGRGKLSGTVARASRAGLIPARAGKTCMASVQSSLTGAHPRAGGENGDRESEQCQTWGSSPRGRGKLWETEAESVAYGLIPARAGKTPRPRSGRPRTAAHPRAGGENLLAGQLSVSLSGSSPRGRGKPQDCADHQDDAGLIPARAGKTPRHSLVRVSSAAHPRAGGENRPHARRRHGTRGSSPRGRGKRPVRWARALSARLIPARAGKTRRRFSSWSPAPAHPRAGGENLETASLEASCAGSSPRGRGKRRGRQPVPDLRGLIPARAGKTGRRGRLAHRRPAHPRAGGENG